MIAATQADASRGVSSRWPSVVFAGSLFALLLGTNLPAPLYGVYQQRFGFSTGVLALVFASYAVVLIPSLLVFGQLSDRVGRKPLLVSALTVAAIGLLLFATARGTGWLFAARAAQGLAVGGASATATSALVEVEPDRHEGRAALYSVVGVSAGAATGPVLAGALAEWGPWPRVLCYLVGLAVTAAVAAAVMRLPEPGEPVGHWRLQRPYVPADVRPQFLRASLTAGCVWMVGALFLSVVPSYTGELLDTGSLVLQALPTTAMLAAACGAHALALRRDDQSPGHLQRAGLVLLVAGVAALSVAWPLRSPAILTLAALIAGVALGLGFGGSQTDVNELASNDRRAEVTAAYIVVVYTGVTVASLIAGRLADVFGIPRAVMTTATAVGVVAVGILWWRSGTEKKG